MGINHLLVNVGGPKNIGQIIRALHVLGGNTRSELYIHDPKGRLTECRSEILSHSLGLFNNGDYTRVDDVKEFLRGYSGRVISTEVSEDAQPITEFTFAERDLVLYGNERSGLPEDIRKNSDEAIIVPMTGQGFELPRRQQKLLKRKERRFPCLNVATTAAIVLFYGLNQLGYFDDFNLEDLSVE